MYIILAITSYEVGSPRGHRRTHTRCCFVAPALQSVADRDDRHAGHVHGGARHLHRQCLAAAHCRQLGASSNESTWVLTSYLVSNAIILPISAWLATRLGRKRFYMSCVALFTVSSFLCGLAPSLGMLIFFRVLQGAGGGGLQPSEQAILADTFPPAKRGMAFAVYGMAVVVAPAIGPTLGGWITDNYSWRWIFYINVPISILSLYLTHRLVEDPPYLEARAGTQKRHARRLRRPRAWSRSAIGCLQIVLDKGQEEDWFSARTGLRLVIAWRSCVLVPGLSGNGAIRIPIVELKLLKKRNFATAMFFMFMLGIVLYGTTVLIPQFLQLLLGYPAVMAGEALAGGGFIMMLMMPISGLLVSQVDPRRSDGLRIRCPPRRRCTTCPRT